MYIEGLIAFLTGIFSEPIPYLGGGFQAVFHDADNVYITDNFPDYVGTITLYGSQMFVEEVLTQERNIIQRQWCTPSFFAMFVEELGTEWGFIASWDNEE